MRACYTKVPSKTLQLQPSHHLPSQLLQKLGTPQHSNVLNAAETWINEISTQSNGSKKLDFSSSLPLALCNAAVSYHGNQRPQNQSTVGRCCSDKELSPACNTDFLSAADSLMLAFSWGALHITASLQQSEHLVTALLLISISQNWLTSLWTH